MYVCPVLSLRPLITGMYTQICIQTGLGGFTGPYQKSFIGKMYAGWLDQNGLDRNRSDADSGSPRNIPGWRGKEEQMGLTLRKYETKGHAALPCMKCNW